MKIFQYNITFGLYMLDPWERWVFNVAALVTVSLLVYSVGRQAQWVWDYLGAAGHGGGGLGPAAAPGGGSGGGGKGRFFGCVGRSPAEPARVADGGRAQVVGTVMEATAVPLHAPFRVALHPPGRPP